MMSGSSPNSPRRYTFVLPRFGKGFVGGAETLVGALVRELHKRGDEVEILTTCARDNRTWENVFSPGCEIIEGIPIHRFLVDERNLDAWVPRQISLHEGMVLAPEDEMIWLSEGVNSSALYEHIAGIAASRDALFFAPYLFPAVYFGALVAPEKSVLIPCLHDEPAAYTLAMKSLFRQVKGCVFNAAPEQDLAESLYGPLRGGEVGMGFEFPEEKDVLSLEPYFEQSFPYLLYVGRKETGKNVHLLVDYFIKAKESALLQEDWKLVVLGHGDFTDVQRPKALERGDVLDLPSLPERDKQRLIRHARLLCQPSTNESFSIVIMEAWMLKVPVLVHARAAVTRGHVLESGGGLLFGDAPDLTGVLRYLEQYPEESRSFAKAGHGYVHEKYSWNAVLDRFDRVVTEIFSCDAPSQGIPAYKQQEPYEPPRRNRKLSLEAH